jgi:hypothetical protein
METKTGGHHRDHAVHYGWVPRGARGGLFRVGVRCVECSISGALSALRLLKRP